jgi:hypothetical protein
MSQGTLTTSRRLFLAGSLATVAGAMFPPRESPCFFKEDTRPRISCDRREADGEI